MSKKNKEQTNYLDVVFSHAKELKWEQNENKEVTLFVENKGLFNLVAQKLIKKPRVSQIHLDEMGNFVWPLIDGKKTVYDIAEMVKEEFGDKAEPLYERLTQYFRILESHGFVIK